jgi:hypothetical protein
MRLAVYATLLVLLGIALAGCAGQGEPSESSLRDGEGRLAAPDNPQDTPAAFAANAKLLRLAALDLAGSRDGCISDPTRALQRVREALTQTTTSDSVAEQTLADTRAALARRLVILPAAPTPGALDQPQPADGEVGVWLRGSWDATSAGCQIELLVRQTISGEGLYAYWPVGLPAAESSAVVRIDPDPRD